MNKLIINNNVFTKENLEYVYENYLGCWVSSLCWAARDLVSQQLGRKLTYKEEAEAFLALFKRMIDDGLILAISPLKDEPEKEVDGLSVWDVPSDRMIEYIRSVFPKELKYLEGGIDDKDDKYGTFWYYHCPQIYWIDKDTGKIFLD